MRKLGNFPLTKSCTCQRDQLPGSSNCCQFSSESFCEKCKKFFILDRKGKKSIRTSLLGLIRTNRINGLHFSGRFELNYEQN